MFPVGAVYITATNTNPQTFLGGTWVAFGQGRTLVGVNTSESEFNSVLKTGGEKTHKLTENEMPEHNHPITGGGSKLALTTGGNMYRVVYEENGLVEQVRSSNTGGSQAHNNLQPYITVYFWRRTK